MVSSYATETSLFFEWVAHGDENLAPGRRRVFSTTRTQSARGAYQDTETGERRAASAISTSQRSPTKLGSFCNTRSECASLGGLVLAPCLNSFSGAAFVRALRGRRRSRR